MDFSALGFNSRRLPTPQLYPANGCSPSPEFYTSSCNPDCWEDCACRAKWRRLQTTRPLVEGTPIYAEYLDALAYHKTAFEKPSPFGSLPGLLTNSGVILVPQQLFGFEYVSGTVGRNTTWMMCAT